MSNYIVPLMPKEIKKIRELLHSDIMSQKVGKYTLSNQIAKKLDKLMEVTE